jgi:hypothetical protein
VTAAASCEEQACVVGMVVDDEVAGGSGYSVLVLAVT